MNFESHIMPRLAKEYKDAGKKRVPFDLDKVRALGRGGDSKSKDKKEFDAQAWDQIDFQDKINGLVTKGLVEQLENKKYQISKLGIEAYVII
jgi:hypothetical protein